MSELTRRSFLKSGAAAGGAAMVGGLGLPAALAQEKFPSQPFTQYSAGSAGGGFDLVARSLAPEWERITGQPYKIIFTPGAGGVLTATKLLSAPPDGHTLAFIAYSSMNVSIHYTKPQGFGFGSFAHLGTSYMGPLALFTGKNSPYQTIDDLVKAGKTKKLTAGISGAREWYHIGGLIFNKRAGLNIDYIPYGGGGPSRKAAASGETDTVMTGLFDAAQDYGILRCLMIFAKKNPIPDVIKAPTMFDVWPDKAIEMMHPAGITTSAEVKKQHPDRYAYLVDTFRKSMAAPATVERLVKAGFQKESLINWSLQEIAEWEKEFIAELKTITL
ncbi:MAG: twin-arginine translocation signal domain-containing protein [Proteobacteria bacterium]|nr:twin-arginine translocation signal domain-containing protein [Pseudomonadota bacterium]